MIGKLKGKHSDYKMKPLNHNPRDPPKVSPDLPQTGTH